MVSYFFQKFNTFDSIGQKATPTVNTARFRADISIFACAQRCKTARPKDQPRRQCMMSEIQNILFTESFHREIANIVFRKEYRRIILNIGTEIIRNIVRYFQNVHANGRFSEIYA